MIGLNTFINSDFLYKPGKELSKLFLAGIARGAAISFLSFFSSVYIYQLFIEKGYGQQKAIYIIILFHLLIVILKQVFLGISENLSQKIGFTGTIRLSLIPFIILILSLVFSERYAYFIHLAGISWGIHAGLFWWGYHGYFIKIADSAKFGEGIGESEMLKTAVTIIAPLVGAVIIDLFGFQIAFVLSGLSMILGVFILGNDKNIKQKHDVKFFDAIKLLAAHKDVAIAYMASGAEGLIYVIVWSLFLYFFFDGVLGMGFVVSLALFLSAIFAIFIGKKIDKSAERNVLSLGSPLFSISWMIRVFSGSPFSFILSDALRNFSEKMVSLPLLGLSYKKGAEGLTSEAILFREIAIGIGAFMALVIIFIFIFLGIDFRQIFIFTAFLVLLPLIPIFSRKI
ncbi:hypothetical protein JXA63_01600 [Candidatus Woesebacteria bacterium]|nr:hypothetical protein [Candidatus Woesebacteria bacterium]